MIPVDWNWLEKLATIGYRVASTHQLPSEVAARLAEAGYVREYERGGHIITAAGRKVIKARDAGEEY